VLTLSIRRFGSFLVHTVADAQAVYCRARDDSGEGASSFPTGRIKGHKTHKTLIVSYNGRVWIGFAGGTEFLEDEKELPVETVEAPDLGWPPGTRPNVLTLDGVDYALYRADITEDEVRGWRYRSATKEILVIDD
jgi:hypothetical protein